MDEEDDPGDMPVQEEGKGKKAEGVKQPVTSSGSPPAKSKEEGKEDKSPKGVKKRTDKGPVEANRKNEPQAKRKDAGLGELLREMEGVHTCVCVYVCECLFFFILATDKSQNKERTGSTGDRQTQRSNTSNTGSSGNTGSTGFKRNNEERGGDNRPPRQQFRNRRLPSKENQERYY